MKQDKTLLLQSYENVFEAQVVKGLLEANDIPVMLINENFDQFHPLYNKSYSGIQLWVFEKDLEEVQRILAADPNTESSESFT